MSVTIRQKNPNAIADLLKRYRNSKELAIGYPLGTEGVSTKYPDGTPVLLVAAANNYGAPSRGIPARDFMSQGGVRALEKTQRAGRLALGQSTENQNVSGNVTTADAGLNEAFEIVRKLSAATESGSDSLH